MSERKILLIDDDPDLRLTLRLPLEAAGYRIHEANSIPAAKVAIKEFHPDLVVLDVMMETATSGFQFALDLHSRDPNSEFKEYRQLPIIMLTAIHSTTPLRFAPDEDYLPVQTFLEKPVEPEDLLAAVRRCIGE
jgi:CheY-like chemotaxis protein